MKLPVFLLVICCGIQSTGSGQVSVAREDFSWNNYKYLTLKEVSSIVLIPSTISRNQADLKESKLECPNLIDVIAEGLHSCDFSKETKKNNYSMFVREDDRFMIRPSEKAQLFGHVLLLDRKNVRIEFFDCISGWGDPVVTIDAEGQEGYSPFESYESAAKKLATLLGQSLKTYSFSFDEESSVSYFKEITDRSFEQFMEAEPDPQKRELPNGMTFEYGNDSKSISAVFVSGSRGTTCSATDTDGEGLAQLVSARLMGAYDIIDRSNLSFVLEEQKQGLSGIFDESTVGEMGRLIGAEGVLVCGESCVGGRSILTIKLLNCQTLEQAWIASGLDIDPLVFVDEVASILQGGR
ncbi:MAG: hypothetical protein O2990_02965 [Bacteroidetes bacterium]|nr:hypothetical protein [Bacteroidota bacterium]